MNEFRIEEDENGKYRVMGTKLIEGYLFRYHSNKYMLEYNLTLRQANLFLKRITAVLDSGERLWDHFCLLK